MKQIVITPALMELALAANPAQKAMLWNWLDELSKDKEWKPDFGNAADMSDVQLYQTLRNVLKLKKLPAKDFSVQVSEVIVHLNEVTGSRFDTNSKSNKSLISQRIAEGYTVDNLKAVVNLQYSKWKGTEYEQYLTPSTLFGNKFQNYYNAASKQPTNNNQQGPTQQQGGTSNRINSIRNNVQQVHERIDKFFGGSGE